jgi:hypothetical protein
MNMDVLFQDGARDSKSRELLLGKTAAGRYNLKSYFWVELYQKERTP